MKVKDGKFYGNVDGAVVEFDDGASLGFQLWGCRYFNCNGVRVNGQIQQIYRKDRGDAVDGCMIELRRLGKYTGEKRYLSFDDVIIAKVGEKLVTIDGVGTIEDIRNYSDFTQFGVRFDVIPARFASMVAAGHFKNGLFYYTSNEADLL